LGLDNDNTTNQQQLTRRLARIDQLNRQFRTNTTSASLIHPDRFDFPELLVGITCSRIGSRPERIMQVTENLGLAMRKAEAMCARILIGKKTAIAPWAAAASELWNIPLEWIEDYSNRSTQKARALSIDSQETAPNKQSTTFPSSFKRFDKWVAESTREASVPDTDQAVIWIPDVLYVPWMRKGGKIETAVLARQRLDPDFKVVTFPSVVTRQKRRTPSPRWVIPSVLASNQWLIHCTRAPQDRWPSETESNYRREILQDPKRALSRHPIDSLARIVAQGQLTAQASVSCRRYPVVCFSARSLDSLLRTRCYRPHLRRWDYEPFGVALSKDFAESIGIQPVIYTDSTNQNGYQLFDRYRLHPKGRTYDWSAEKEWRSPVSVKLRKVPNSDIRIFAEDSKQSRLILQQCPWPVEFLARSDSKSPISDHQRPL